MNKQEIEEITATLKRIADVLNCDCWRLLTKETQDELRKQLKRFLNMSIDADLKEWARGLLALSDPDKVDLSALKRGDPVRVGQAHEFAVVVNVWQHKDPQVFMLSDQRVITWQKKGVKTTYMVLLPQADLLTILDDTHPYTAATKIFVLRMLKKQVLDSLKRRTEAEWQELTGVLYSLYNLPATYHFPELLLPEVADFLTFVSNEQPLFATMSVISRFRTDWPTK